MIDPHDIDDLGDPRPRNHGKPSIPQGEVGVPQPTFAEEVYRPTYVFAGLRPYVDREAERVNYPDHSLRSRMHGDWFVTQVANSLGNACGQRRQEDAKASIDRAVSLRDILAVALAASEAAIVEVARNLNLPEPPFAKKPEVTANGPRKLRRTEHPGE